MIDLDKEREVCEEPEGEGLEEDGEDELGVKTIQTNAEDEQGLFPVYFSSPA